MIMIQKEFVSLSSSGDDGIELFVDIDSYNVVSESH